MIRRTSRKQTPTASSVVTIATASGFVFATAVVGMVVDQDGIRPGAIGETWTLRGQVDETSVPLPARRHT